MPAKQAANLPAEAIDVPRDTEPDEHSGTLIGETPAYRNGEVNFTALPFETVNKVQAHGGAINTSGAVVVNGMLFVGSGYAISSAASGGNVLLAFGAE